MVFLSAGVYSKETDLSQVVQVASTSVGAIVGAFDKGPLGPFFVSTEKQFVETFGKPNPKTSYAYYAALDFLAESKQLWVNRVMGTGFTYPVMVLNVTTPATSTLVAGVAAADPTAYTFTAGDACIIYPVGAGTGYSNLKIAVDSVSTIEGTFTLSVYDSANMNKPLESFAVSKTRQLDGSGRQTFIADVINTFSKLIRVVDNALVTTQPTAAVTAVALTGGSNGAAVADAQITTGWDQFANPEIYTINILINGGYSTVTVHQKMISLAESRADCFAILDLPSASQAVAAAVTYRSTTLNANSSYAALYGPDFMRYDQYNDMQMLVPPSGAVAAIFARTDYQRDPWFAPAGLNRGVIKNAISLRQQYSQGDRDTLYPIQINPIKITPGAGISVFGQKTLQSKMSALSSINVRRLLLVCEKAMASALQYSLFEPNDPFTRIQIASMLTEFLQDVQNRRGIYTFQVVADESNNTATVIDRNELRVDVYIQPTRAAEFIQLQTVITRTGASFQELIASGGPN
jgi:phage tail sheath protein FI